MNEETESMRNARRRLVEYRLKLIKQIADNPSIALVSELVQVQAANDILKDLLSSPPD